MILLYPEEREVFADASDLLIHHVKRQASLSKREKISIKVELQIRYLIMHMFVRTTYLMATIPYCPISILTNLLIDIHIVTVFSIKRLLRSVVPRLFNLEVESISDDDDEQQIPMQQYSVNKDDEGFLFVLLSKY